MTKEERQQSLTNARLACDYIKFVVHRQLALEHQKQVECLLDEFKRLDEKEQKQIRGGEKGAKFGHLGAEHGHKGGRPRKTERK